MTEYTLKNDIYTAIGLICFGYPIAVGVLCSVVIINIYIKYVSIGGGNK